MNEWERNKKRQDKTECGHVILFYYATLRYVIIITTITLHSTYMRNLCFLTAVGGSTAAAGGPVE